MAYDIENLPQHINIGASGTNRQRIIAFDVTKWREKWPTATFNICVLRPYDSQVNVYIGDSELDGNTLYWIVHYADTAQVGNGWMEIHATISGEDTLFAKSKRVVIAIDESVCDTAGDAPEPSEPWVARIEAAAAAAVEAAETLTIDTTLSHAGQVTDAKATGLACGCAYELQPTYDASEFVRGGLTNGVIMPALKYRIVTDRIHRALYDIHLEIISGFRIAVHYYDDSGNYTTNSGAVTGEYTIPKGSNYRFVITRIVEDSSEIADLAEFAANVIKRGSLQMEVQRVSVDVLSGKKWNVMGDSITANPAYAASRYFEWINSRHTGMTIRNYGIGGTRIGGADSNAFCNRFSSMENDASLVTVFGGVNDYGQPNPTPIGTYGDATNATFYGALKILCEGLIAKYKTAAILFITPIQPNYANWDVGTGANSLGFTIEDYANAIKRVCGRYGIPVLDAGAVCGFTSLDSGQKTQYFYDGLHLNINGHKRISYLIEDALAEAVRGKT